MSAHVCKKCYSCKNFVFCSLNDSFVYCIYSSNCNSHLQLTDSCAFSFKSFIDDKFYNYISDKVDKS